MDFFYPAEWLAEKIVQGWLGLAPESYLAGALHFFIYDLIKIGLLLLAINYLMAIVRHYLPTEKVRDILARRRWFGLNYVLAALLGVITPFCSCSSIPLFIGFVGAGIPLGVTFSFLIASPLVNEASLYLFPALFGMKVTLIYNLIGVAVAVLGGVLINKLRLEKHVIKDLIKAKPRVHQGKNEKTPVIKLLTYWWDDSWAITRQVFPYVALGVALGALIHGFVPASFAENYLSSTSWWAVPAAVLAGAPFYANSISVIPVMQAIVGKGVPLGTALAFMTSIVTLSIPELLILRKVMKWQLLAWFVGITLAGIIIMGYVLNAVL